MPLFLSRAAAPPPQPDGGPHLAAASVLLTEARSRLDQLEATLLGPLKLAAAANASSGGAGVRAVPPPPPTPLSTSSQLAALAGLAALSYAAASAIDALRTAAGPALSAALTLARAPPAAVASVTAAAPSSPRPPAVRTRARQAWRALRPAARDCAEAATRLASHGVLIVALARHLAAAGGGTSGSGGGLGGAAGWLLSAFGSPAAAAPAAAPPASAASTGPSPGQAMMLCAAGWAAVGWAASDSARWAEEAGLAAWAGEVAGRLAGRGGASDSAPATPAAGTASVPATPTGTDLARLARARFGADAGRRAPAPAQGWCTPLGAGTPTVAAGAGGGPFGRPAFHLRASASGATSSAWYRPRRRHSAGADGGDALPAATLVRLPPPVPSPPPPAACSSGRGGEAEPATDLPACRICWVAPRAVAFLPCGHVGACAGCTLRLFEAAGGGGSGAGGDNGGGGCAGVPCPFCGQAVADVARVFIV